MKRTVTFMAITAAMTLLMASCDKASDEMAEEKKKQEQQGQESGDDGTLLHLNDILFDENATAQERKEWYGRLGNKGYSVTTMIETGSIGTNKYSLSMLTENKAYNITIDDEWTNTSGRFYGTTAIMYQLSSDKKDKYIKEIEQKFSCKMEDITDYMNKTYSESGFDVRFDIYLKAQIQVNGASDNVIFTKASNESFGFLVFQDYS